jgi:hypothetical protein
MAYHNHAADAIGSSKILPAIPGRGVVGELAASSSAGCHRTLPLLAYGRSNPSRYRGIASIGIRLALGRRLGRLEV